MLLLKIDDLHLRARNKPQFLTCVYRIETARKKLGEKGFAQNILLFCNIKNNSRSFVFFFLNFYFVSCLVYVHYLFSDDLQFFFSLTVLFEFDCIFFSNISQ